MKKNLAQAYSGGREVKNWDIPALAGAGALRSSVSDMLKYLEANLGLKKTDIYPEMKLAHTPLHSKAGTIQVGFAWIIKKEDDVASGIMEVQEDTGPLRDLSMNQKQEL